MSYVKLISMPYLTAGDTEVVIIGENSAERAVVNVLVVKNPEDIGEDAARDVLNNWQDHIMEILSSTYTLLEARWRAFDDTTGTIAPDPAKNLVGQNADAPASPNVSLLVKKNISGTVGRRRGRLFLSPTSETSITADGSIVAGDLVTYQGFVDDFYEGVDDISQLVVVHRDPETGDAVASSDVVSMSVDTKAATQRRRLRK